MHTVPIRRDHEHGGPLGTIRLGVRGTDVSGGLGRVARVPRLSEFYGVVIYMYFADHNPPHFHAIYGEHEALIGISDGAVLGGRRPRTAARLVEQWRTERKPELAASCDLTQVPAPLGSIKPLQ